MSKSRECSTLPIHRILNTFQCAECGGPLITLSQSFPVSQLTNFSLSQTLSAPQLTNFRCTTTNPPVITCQTGHIPHTGPTRCTLNEHQIPAQSHRIVPRKLDPCSAAYLPARIPSNCRQFTAENLRFLSLHQSASFSPFK